MMITGMADPAEMVSCLTVGRQNFIKRIVFTKKKGRVFSTLPFLWLLRKESVSSIPMMTLAVTTTEMVKVIEIVMEMIETIRVIAVIVIVWIIVIPIDGIPPTT